MGGDEFVVLVTDSSVVREADRDFQLRFSTGVAAFDPGHPETLEELLSEADSRMYLDKRRRKDAAAH
jgi:GGDEF domain-containing protein